MDVEYPERYHLAAAYFDSLYGDIETSSELDSEHKLMFYALRRQCDDGPCTLPAPPLWRQTERHKYNAWKNISRMTRPEAMVHFVRQFENYLGTPVRWIEKRQPEATAMTHGHDIDAEAIGTAQSALEVEDDLTSHGPSTHGPPELSVQHESSAVLTIDSGKVDHSSEHESGNRYNIAPAYLIASVSEDSGAELHDDIRAHAAPTDANMRYLVSQVMHARRLCCELMKNAPVGDEQERALPIPIPVNQCMSSQCATRSSTEGADYTHARLTLTHSPKMINPYDDQRCCTSYVHSLSSSSSHTSGHYRSPLVRTVSPHQRKAMYRVPSDIFNV